ncbi:MAG: hypothetical protein ACK4GT_11845 [Pararhodobacter sp.]
MRPVTLTDLAAAARVLLALPPEQRAAGMAALIARAEAADSHRLATGRDHRYGNGTLGSAALTCAAADPAEPGDAEYLGCLALAVNALLEAPLENRAGSFILPDRNSGDAPCPNSSPN